MCILVQIKVFFCIEGHALKSLYCKAVNSAFLSSTVAHNPVLKTQWTYKLLFLVKKTCRFSFLWKHGIKICDSKIISSEQQENAGYSHSLDLILIDLIYWKVECQQWCVISHMLPGLVLEFSEGDSVWSSLTVWEWLQLSCVTARCRTKSDHDWWGWNRLRDVTERCLKIGC